VKADGFFIGPDKSLDKENILMPGEILTAVQIPPAV